MWRWLGVERKGKTLEPRPSIIHLNPPPGACSLHNFEEYLQAAEDLVVTPNVFLTTDDESIIKDVEEETVFGKTTKKFTFYYTR